MVIVEKTDLTKKTCKPCEGGVSAMSKSQAEQMLKNISGWELCLKENKISKTFKFGDFYKTMAFVNAIAWVAGRENHHPQMEVSYGKCKIDLSTHAIGGLSENDFILAAKIDALTE